MPYPIPREDIPFVPLKLPIFGEDCLEGRQYEIDPVARAVIQDRFGISPPKYVECVHSKACARTITTVTTFADGRPSTTTVMEIPLREATFRGFFKYKKSCVFTLDLNVVANLRQFYVDAPIAPEEDVGSPRNKVLRSPSKRVEKVDLGLLGLL